MSDGFSEEFLLSPVGDNSFMLKGKINQITYTINSVYITGHKKQPV